MQIMIDIDEEQYKFIKQNMTINKIKDYPALLFDICEHIANGVPLPKGHGNIIDVQDAVDNLMEYKEIGIFGNHDKRTILGCIDRIENHVEPIIEADKTESEVKK